MRRIVLVAFLLCCPTGGAWSAQTDKEDRLPVREDVVAVVLSNTGKPRGSIVVSYSGVVARATVMQDLLAMQQAAGWRFSAVALEHQEDETQATAVMRPAAADAGSYGKAAWPVAWALRRFSRMTILLTGQAGPGTTQRIENDYVRVTISGSGTLTCYDVTVKDNSFKSITELGAFSTPSSAPKRRRPEPLQRTYRWYILVIAAVVVSVLVYAIARRLARVDTGRARRTS